MYVYLCRYLYIYIYKCNYMYRYDMYLQPLCMMEIYNHCGTDRGIHLNNSPDFESGTS